ncbi:type II toxin-antitoxin system HipA family toxin [Bifidobacterium imperatoris]|uniref:Transcriptional regulator n=1 Tax=Bifidobacterium imperatoris TaxID=2020965 RepID=A0A2N5IUZ5_9BIFI|nr:type II toxin-antitoxin system HipA family toxin [Bifidobacterium imperatoris]PLS25782.1 transcriptional regulator [Bifidobacterium imperatoris]QSY58260.1 type II toxin-antitoxin system HipA family toxin [Bifidobacterium imperatoris]
MKPKELLVYVEDQYCGVLREDNRGKHSFEYDISVANPPQISLSMPVRSEPWTGIAVEAYIDGILPDSRDMRQRIANLYGVNANNPFALLTAVGLDCAGGIQFVLPENAENFRQESQLRPIDDKHIAERLRAISAARGPSWQIDDEHWSLNGAQDKIALQFNNGKWYEALGSAATTHIIKPGIDGLHEQAFNEYICMQTLHSLGIPVATSQFHIFDGLPAIVSTRWDRARISDDQGGTIITRIHQEDMCQATSHMTSEKYQTDGGPSAIEIFKCIQDNDLGEDSSTLFLIALILNFLMGGIDSHAKNYAILEPAGKRPTLAPLYDIASIYAYEPLRKQRKLAMSIGGEYNYKRIDLRHWRNMSDAVSSDMFEFAKFFLQQYALLLPDAFHQTSLHALEQPALQLTDQPANDISLENRKILVQRIQAGINAQCDRVLGWFGKPAMEF